MGAMMQLKWQVRESALATTRVSSPRHASTFSGKPRLASHGDLLGPVPLTLSREPTPLILDRTFLIGTKTIHRQVQPPQARLAQDAATTLQLK